MPPWRLPPDGWILRDLSGRNTVFSHVALRPDARGLSANDLAHSIRNDADGYDYVARLLAEGSDPAPTPFQPITERRLEDEALVEALQSQERRNLEQFGRHAEALRAQKQATASAMASVLSDPLLQLELPPDAILYHQIGRRRLSRERPEELRATRAFHMYAALTPGQVITFDHHLSTTTKVWWFGTLQNPPRPDALNVGRADEDALRLEMNPRRGLYIGELASTAIGANASAEREVIIPTGGLWEVVGVRDVVQPSVERDRLHLSRSRLRAVQLREITQDAIGDRDVQSMTF